MKKWLLIILSCALLYIPIFPGTTRTELSLEPLWVAEPVVSRASGSSTFTDTMLPFRVGSAFGYVSEDGALMLVEPILHDVAIDREGFVNYSSIGNDLVVQLPTGTVSATLSTRGYPMFLDGRLFVVATNRARLEEWSVDGALLWSREFGSLITAMDVRGDFCVIGLLDGGIRLFDRNGESRFDSRLSESRVSAVYGCTVSRSGEIVLVIHGLEPQLLTVFHLRDERYIATDSIVLENEFRSNRLVYLTPDEKAVFVEDSDGLYVHRIGSTDQVAVRLDGELVDFGSLWTGRLHWFAFRHDGHSSIAMVNGFGLRIYSQMFATDMIGGHSTDTTIYLGVDHLVAGIDVLLE